MDRRDKLLLMIDSFVMGAINKIQMLNLSNAFINLKRNSELKGNYNECFVIGNGPSLTQEDLNVASNYDSINVNFFYEGKYEFKGKYLVFVDPAFATLRGINYVKKCKKANPELKIVTNYSNYRYFKKKMCLEKKDIYYINTALKQHGDYVKMDICRMMTGGLNVIPVAIETAIGMGYKKIYLLGCDFSFYGTKDPGKHFYDENKKKRTVDDYNTVGNLIRCALVQQHHFAIQKYCRKHGVKIVNLTPGSLIMAYKLKKIRK